MLNYVYIYFTWFIQVETLVNASPATVSRAGIIFVSDTDLDWSPVVEGWILKRPAAEQPVFKDLFSRCDAIVALS